MMNIISEMNDDPNITADRLGRYLLMKEPYLDQLFRLTGALYINANYLKYSFSGSRH